MARVAILADIHGNLPALKAVIRDLDQQQVDEVVLGGDLVGRGPQGSAVLGVARERGWRSIRGNHEDYLLAFRRTDVPESWLTARVWSAARWMAAELSEQDVREMESMSLPAPPVDAQSPAGSRHTSIQQRRHRPLDLGQAGPEPLRQR